MLLTNNASSRKEDIDIRENILIEYQNEEKKLISPNRKSDRHYREFKFSMVSNNNDKNLLKDFDSFTNNYSQDYKNIDVTQYQSSNFELQVRPTIEDKLLRKYTNDNMFIDEDTDFIIMKDFDQKIFNQMKNGYSKDFNFKRDLKISKDDSDYTSKSEKGKIMI
mgnify:CR=1 FL=1